MIRIVHLLDDFAMGGVSRALSLFEEPTMTRLSRSTTLAMQRNMSDAPLLDADLIVIHVPPCWSRLPYLAALRKRNLQARIVQVEHSYTRSFEQLRVTSPKRFRLLLRLAAGLVDELISVSQAQAQWLVEAGIPARKVTTILPWSGRFELSRVPDRIEHRGPLRLLAYGRFSQEKNFGALIEAVGYLRHDEVELTLFGGGPDEEALTVLANAIPQVNIMPACGDPAPWLAQCDVVVMPSKHESFGLVATEARMAGRAILVANVDGLPEQAWAGGGLVAPLGTAEEIANAVSDLIKRDLTALGRAARAGVSTQHDEIIRGWKEVIERAAAPAKEHRSHQYNELARA
ncbi:glycosyltransferase [Altererythrobacter confluentis]|uniref:Glycosyltransferase n=1 Tax=Allopontixanthobacter confluentis TaxID=1849021 RepID=A0A6L7GEX8_9SPHN|nr:glycosyltransferase family 4 protein [Allopontixanthobacter confluentis]MXP14180.1 glycosyltransferase [Allopontixanthobacter confluentis]